MSSIKAPTQCPHKSKIHAFPPKGIISLQYLNHAPHSTEKNTAIDQSIPKRSHPNPVYNPDSNSLPASVAVARLVTFKRGDGSALVHPPRTLPSSTPMTRSSPPRGISNYRGTQYKQTNT